MAYVFQTRGRDGKLHPKWRYRVIDYLGRRRTATGTTSESETRRMALQAEARAARIKAGLEAPPTGARRHRQTPVADVVKQYLAWGGVQGGKHGRPWSFHHARKRKKLLDWWVDRLGLSVLADLDASLPRVEEALRDLQGLSDDRAEGRSGKTLQNYRETIRGFCRWAVQRGYLAADPLAGMASFNTTPQTTRRALTAAEIGRLLAAAPRHRALVYEAALCSGLRRNELRCLSVADLDAERGGLHLHAEWTKNRKAGFQPLPAALVDKLKAFAESGAALKLYRDFYRRRNAKVPIPEAPLVYVPRNTAREFDKDLAAAKIAKQTPAGKVDFHACRVAYVSFVLQAGAGVKEAQSLARHGTPTLTMNTYGRADDTRLVQLAEAVGTAVLPPDSTATAQLKATGTDNACAATGYDEQARGNDPHPRPLPRGRGEEAEAHHVPRAAGRKRALPCYPIPPRWGLQQLPVGS